MLQIVTFKWGTRYRPEHVAKLRSMLARNLTIPWEFVLISDDPEDEAVSMAPGYYGGAKLGAIPGGCRWVPLWNTLRDLPGCGVRLHAFHPSMAELIGPRFAWIDMDVVVTGNVDHIFGRPEPFVMLATPKPPLPYNGSFVMMDAGARAGEVLPVDPRRYAGVADQWWTDDEPRRRVPGGPSDEKWIGACLCNEDPRLPMAKEATVGGLAGVDGIYYYRRHLQEAGRERTLPDDARLVIFNGRGKPWDADVRARSPWIVANYR